MSLSPASSHGAASVAAVQVALTNAQVLALPTTPVQVVAAPGTAKAIIPVHAVAVFSRTADYTNIDPSAVFRFRTNTGSDTFLAQLRELATDGNVSGLLANGGDTIAVFPAMGGVNEGTSTKTILAAFEGDQLATLANAALTVQIGNGAAGNLTGGDAANVLTIAVAYYMLTLP